MSIFDDNPYLTWDLVERLHQQVPSFRDFEEEFLIQPRLLYIVSPAVDRYARLCIQILERAGWELVFYYHPSSPLLRIEAKRYEDGEQYSAQVMTDALRYGVEDWIETRMEYILSLPKPRKRLPDIFWQAGMRMPDPNIFLL